MRVMIVDDEPIFIKGIRKLIEDFNRANKTSHTVVSEVYDGIEAMELIPSLAPELIFTDISMASMDGIQLAQKVHELWPAIYVVVISGYPSFENARDAFKANVIDFIQKPIQPQLFMDLVERLDLKYQHEHGKNALASLLFYENPASSTADIHQDLARHKNFSYILLHTNEFSKFMGLASQLKDTLHASAQLWSFEIENFSELLIVIASNALSDQEMKDCLALCQKLHPADLPLQLGFHYNFPAAQLKIIYKTIQQNLHKQIILGESGIYRLLGTPFQNMQEYTAISQQHENKLAKYIKDKDFAALEKYLTNLFAIWQNERAPLALLNQNLKRIMQILSKEQANLGIFELEAITELLLFSSTSYEDLKRRFLLVLLREFGLDADKSIESHETLFTQIQQFLFKNLSEPVSLGRLSEVYRVSISHLCNIFKEQANTTFVDYFTDMRIRKAQELIRNNSELQLKEVAELIGFSDQRYFSKVFKTQTGMTPSEYKNK